MRDWLMTAQRLVDDARPHGSVLVRYNDLIDAIAIALREAANPVNITEHDPWMHRLAGRLASIDIRLRMLEDAHEAQIPVAPGPDQDIRS
jgi:hypothetical protein